jgi:large subunit ribosomal protein L15
MGLNNLKPAAGSVKKNDSRRGRGEATGNGGTAGRGHKGAKSRSGYSKKVGFEGGQMPLQRRVPKFGFTSKKSLYVCEVRLNELNDLGPDIINLDVLKRQGVIANNIRKVRIIASGKNKKAITVSASLHCTRGSRHIIVSSGGKVVEL